MSARDDDRRGPAEPPLATPLQALQAWLPQARAVGAGDGTGFLRVCTDSRSLQPGDLFVALVGERFDAHDFLPQARAAGAVAALASRGLEAAGLPGFEVADTLQALQDIAQGWRAARTLPLIAVTGSNGKTTVTQMTGAILRAAVGEAALVTRGNLNNHIGVPLTLLSLQPAHRLAVVELGMNHPGEIARLAELAQPTVALVNNAQREHQEFMHTVEAVARENGAALQALPPHGTAVFPEGDVWTPLWRELAGGRAVLTFGESAQADVRACGAEWRLDHWAFTLRTPQGAAPLRLAMAGRHNLRNALAAAACALAAGVALADVVAGLEAFRAVGGRSQLHRLTVAGQPLTLVDDSYNANPDSVRAAIEVLAELPGPRWLVLGDMGEVGDQGPAFHAEVGALAAERGIERVWCVGALAAHAAAACGPAARHFNDRAAALQALQDLAVWPETASMLVKGSRFMRMEQVVEAVRVRPAQGSTEVSIHAA